MQVNNLFITRQKHVTLSTQGGRQESHTSLIKAVFSSSSFSSGCHVDGEEELSSCVVEVHGEGDLERREGRGVTVSKMCSLMTLNSLRAWFYPRKQTIKAIETTIKAIETYFKFDSEPKMVRWREEKGGDQVKLTPSC